MSKHFGTKNMAQQSINTGSSPNSRDGDSLRAAFTKINQNFDELYSALGLGDASLNIGAFEFSGSTLTTTDSSAVIIDQATVITSDLTVGGDLKPSVNFGGDLGSPTHRWDSIYLNGNTIFLGNTSISVNESGGLNIGGSPLTASAVDWANVTNRPTFASVATSGDYDDLDNKPTIPTVPTDISQLNNDTNFIVLQDAIDYGFLTAADITGGIIGFNYNEDGGTSEIGVTADVFDFGDGKTIDMQNSSILLSGSTITGPMTVDGAGSLIQTVTEGDASAIGGIAYSYNGVSIGVTANPEGEFNTEQSTIQVSSGEVLLRSTAEQNGDTQYTSTGELRLNSSMFRISLAPGPQWQGELTFDENEFRIPSDTLVVEGATLRLNNMSDISIPTSRGQATFNLSITGHPQYTYSISAINGNEVTVTHSGGYPIPQVDWVMYDPLSNITTAYAVVDVIGDSNVSTVTMAAGYDYSQLSELILWDLNQLADPWQVSIGPTGELNGITSINGVREIVGNAFDQWSYLISPMEDGSITNMAFGYFGEGGLQNVLNGTTSIHDITVGPLSSPEAPYIQTTVSEENGVSIDLNIYSGTSGDVSGHVTIGTGTVGTRGEIFLNGVVNAEGGSIKIDSTGSLLPATRLTKEFIEFQGASQLSMPHDNGISKFVVDIATAEFVQLYVDTETVSGSDTTWVGGDIFATDLSTIVGWVYTDGNGVNHVITGASDVDLDGNWDIVFAGTNPDLTAELGAGPWSNIRIWNPENVDNTRTIEIDSDGILTGVTQINNLDSIDTNYLSAGRDIQIGMTGAGYKIGLNHDQVQITSVPPTTSKGAAGDVIGLVAFDGNYIYYCTNAYVAATWANSATVDIVGGNGVDSGIAITLGVVPSVGWSISNGTTTSTINQVVPQASWYVIFWDDPITFDVGDTVFYGATAPVQADIWKRVAWSGDTW